MTGANTLLHHSTRHSQTNARSHPPFQHSVSSDSYSAIGPVLTDCATTTAQLVAANGIRGELLAILNELRFITRKIKDENDVAEETNDWKFAAMVIDRLCFWIFSIYLVAATAQRGR